MVKYLAPNGFPWIRMQSNNQNPKNNFNLTFDNNSDDHLI